MVRHILRAIVGSVVIGLAVPAAAQGQNSEATRERWQKVDEVFQAMDARPGAVVADLGAGDGFFTSRLAKAVGADGKVYAIDIGASALKRLRTRVETEQLKQVEVIEGTVDDPKLPAGALDAILIVNAYHEMKAFKELLPRLRTALKPDGRLVIVEPIAASRRDKSRDEQTRNHEIAIDFVRQDTREAGFVQVSMQDPFTTREHAHGNTQDEMWMLVLRPATAATAARSLWSASKEMNWEAPELRITPAAFKKLAPSDVLVLDVRDAEMFRAGRLPGAQLMTIETLGTPDGIAPLKNEKRLIVTYCSCESEQSSARAALMLKAQGVPNVLALVGGYEEWVKRGDAIAR